MVLKEFFVSESIEERNACDGRKGELLENAVDEVKNKLVVGGFDYFLELVCDEARAVVHFELSSFLLQDFLKSRQKILGNHRRFILGRGWTHRNAPKELFKESFEVLEGDVLDQVPTGVNQESEAAQNDF